MAIVYRLIKNSELTWLELDGNFSFLEDKIDQVAVQTGSPEIVRVTPQVFLPAEEGQARANIKAASVDQVVDLSDRVDFLETYNPVMYTPQILLPQEQQTARENIDSLGASPNGTDKLIGTNNKINDSYLPDSLFGQMKWGGNFNENGIISATADYSILQGTNISNLNTVQYKGVYFIAAFSTDTIYNLHGVDYNNGDWAAANGNANGFNKADNSDAVTSVAGKRGAVTLDTNDIQGLTAALAGKADAGGGNITNAAQWKSKLRMTLQEVTANGNSTTNDLIANNYDSNGIDGFTTDGSDSNGYRGFRWKTNGNLRWLLAIQPNQEQGGGTGSDLSLYNYSDSGGYLGCIFTVNRASGVITFKDNIATYTHYTSAEWAKAYNERVVQFNTSYTTNVYTFSLLLGNGTTKSINLQVSVTYFTINSSGVLELNSTVRSQLAEIGNKRTYSLTEIGNNDYVKESAITDSFPINGLEVVVYNAQNGNFESPLSGSNYRETFMSLCGLYNEDKVFLKGLVETSADLSSLISAEKFHLCMVYTNVISSNTGSIEWMSAIDIFHHRRSAGSNEIKDVIKIADIVSPNSVFVNPKNI